MSAGRWQVWACGESNHEKNKTDFRNSNFNGFQNF